MQLVGATGLVAPMNLDSRPVHVTLSVVALPGIGGHQFRV